MRDAINNYLRDVEHEFQTGIASEHAYRPALKRLLEAAEGGLNAVNDPKRIAIGAPDFHVLREQTTIGFVEAKDIDKSLDDIEKTDQMDRYRHGLANLILTDYLEFRWYVGGEHRQTARVASIDDKRIRADATQFDDLGSLLRQFVITVTPTVRSPQELARRMANIAQLINAHIADDLKGETPDSSLIAQRDAFAKTLLPDIDNAQFADMYAQTLAYGLFAARFNYHGDPTTFKLETAGRHIPATNPFLGKLFRNIRQNLGERIVYLGETLADLLAHTDTDEILKDFGRATRQLDPVVHFYETFLSEYNPKLREQRGVYYTPEPVVSYIVRSVDHILRERFGRGMGLGDEETLVLDPATGTGTFLYFTIKHIYDTYFTGQRGMWRDYVRNSLLKRIFGFELLMAPYAVAHMKLGLLLQQPAEHETATYEFTPGERLGVYLTNTLEEQFKQEPLAFAEYITEEANEATAVKRDKPIMVVLGNPPYSGHSANKGEWIGKLLRDYYFVDGEPLGERNPKWLQNDYVKFIRFGQWRIDKTGGGILAFITDNSYLDNITFRGMRQQLMQTFSDIYILDLHGNSNKKETAPDGSTDQNVFDIMQGVAIVLFVKDPNQSGMANVHHLDLWGRREDKYQWLFENDVFTTGWDQISPKTHLYLFTPQDTDLLSEYQSYCTLSEIMSTNTVGVVTGQDKKTIGFTNAEASKLAEKQLLSNDIITNILYRPFDSRYILYDSKVVTRPRTSVMRHVLGGDNFSMIATRQTRDLWCVSTTNTIMGHKSMAAYDINYLFPLYLYPEKREGELFGIEDDGSDWPLSSKGRRPNLNPAFVQDMANKLGLEFITDGRGDLKSTFGPEDVFHYAYAVFHSPTYRERYAEFLKIDFPRLPLTGDVALFRALCGFGAELVALHLMQHPALNTLITQYPVEGDNVVAAKGSYPKYSPPPAPSVDLTPGPSPNWRGEQDSGRVWINKT